MTRTLSDTLAPQLEQLTKLARMADERGFMIVLVGPPDGWKRKYTTIVDKRLFGYFSGGMSKFLEEYKRLTGRRVLRIIVQEPDPTGAFSFNFDVPMLVRFKPLVAALDLFSRERKGRYAPMPTGPGFLTCTRYSDRFEYLGHGKNALTAVVRVLEMPHHREILFSTNRGNNE